MTPTRAPASAALFDRARAVTPGGVNSPVRAFNAVGGTPRFMRSASGAWLTDVDGRRYVDLICSWGPMLLGHAHPEVLAAVSAAVARGTSYGTPTEPEVELAEEIVARTPVEAVRFVSSGTEATMSAIRLARGFTGRDVIVKFAGCYHGHVDSLLASAGSGVATHQEFAVPGRCCLGLGLSLAGSVRVRAGSFPESLPDHGPSFLISSPHSPIPCAWSDRLMLDRDDSKCEQCLGAWTSGSAARPVKGMWHDRLNHERRAAGDRLAARSGNARPEPVASPDRGNWLRHVRRADRACSR